MVEIDSNNINEYISEDVVDEIVDQIHAIVNKNIAQMSELTIGCIGFPDVPTINNGTQNIYFEYHIKLLRNSVSNVTPFELNFHYIFMFSGDTPDFINQRIEKVNAAITNRLNL